MKGKIQSLVFNPKLYCVSGSYTIINYLGRKWDIRYLFQFRVTEDVVMSNSEVVIYNRQRSPNNQYQSHQTPADASGVENTCSAAERSCAVSYADPVDTLINLPHSYDSCVDNGLYAGPKYEEPRSFDAVSTPVYHSVHMTMFMYIHSFFAEYCVISIVSSLYS